MRRIALLPLSFMLLLLLSSCKEKVHYKVFALRFNEGYYIPANIMVKGAAENDSIDVCNMFWLLQSNKGENILVDAGYIDTTGKDSTYVRPDKFLERLGVFPGEVSAIIVTHPHIDHIDGISLFPDAMIWMQKEDYEYFIGDAWEEGGQSFGFSKEDVDYIKEVAANKRLRLIEGDSVEFMPGIRSFKGSRHTQENIYLLVNEGEPDQLVLASDAEWFYMNLEKMLPATLAMDQDAYVTAMQRMKTMVDDPRMIIPGHDNTVFKIFPEAEPGIVQLLPLQLNK